MLSIAFDANEGHKYSTLRKTQYNKHRQTLMKLMNFNKKLEIKDVVMKMEITNPSIERTAKKVLIAYVKQAVDVDLDHPQFQTMSVYQACKIENVKTTKKKLIAMSNLKPNQWTQLEKIFDTDIQPLIKPEKPNKVGLQSSEIIEQASNESSQQQKRKMKTPEVEDYETWKKKTLAKAYAEL